MVVFKFESKIKETFIHEIMNLVDQNTSFDFNYEQEVDLRNNKIFDEVYNKFNIEPEDFQKAYREYALDKIDEIQEDNNYI